jgi:hypothetical protein
MGLGRKHGSAERIKNGALGVTSMVGQRFLGDAAGFCCWPVGVTLLQD